MAMFRSCMDQACWGGRHAKDGKREAVSQCSTLYRIAGDLGTGRAIGEGRSRDSVSSLSRAIRKQSEPGYISREGAEPDRGQRYPRKSGSCRQSDRRAAARRAGRPRGTRRRAALRSSSARSARHDPSDRRFVETIAREGREDGDVGEGAEARLVPYHPLPPRPFADRQRQHRQCAGRARGRLARNPGPITSVSRKSPFARPRRSRSRHS